MIKKTLSKPSMAAPHTWRSHRVTIINSGHHGNSSLVLQWRSRHHCCLDVSKAADRLNDECKPAQHATTHGISAKACPAADRRRCCRSRCPRRRHPPRSPAAAAPARPRVPPLPAPAFGSVPGLGSARLHDQHVAGPVTLLPELQAAGTACRLAGVAGAMPLCSRCLFSSRTAGKMQQAMI